jgi:hypothetical protein
MNYRDLTYSEAIELVTLNGLSLSEVRPEIIDMKLAVIAFENNPRSIEFIPVDIMLQMKMWFLTAIQQFPEIRTWIPKESREIMLL